MVHERNDGRVATESGRKACSFAQVRSRYRVAFPSELLRNVWEPAERVYVKRLESQVSNLRYGRFGNLRYD